MAQSLSHAQRQTEKSSSVFTCLRQVESRDIMKFCAEYSANKDSIVPPHEHISSTVRDSLLQEVHDAHLLVKQKPSARLIKRSLSTGGILLRKLFCKLF